MKYRKLPVIVEARQWDGDWDAMWKWLVDIASSEAQYVGRDVDNEMSIRTLAGKEEVRLNDWIICEVNGELHSCKPEIFTKTHVPATPSGDDQTQEQEN